ncbi:hypothetical protein HPB51_015043 [Rhipicephalus microplus]|uniref:Transmembrane protein n=1 Tax=Rhipicephalus microplus TaxID=6941 RepID=A0A9J6ET55_RHIMP|nr:hypothetical protein HPB51_015043 [Rhipicephalus microplus]
MAATCTLSAIEIWIPSANVTISATDSHCTSSTATELAALRATFNHIVDQTAVFRIIFTDSRAALPSLMSPCTQDPVIMDIKCFCKKACDLHHRIVLQGIPAHCAGKAGHDTSGEIVEIPFSRQDAATIVNKIGLSDSPSSVQCNVVEDIDPVLYVSQESSFTGDWAAASTPPRAYQLVGSGGIGWCSFLVPMLAVKDSGADAEELAECWELVQKRMKRAQEVEERERLMFERETVRRKEEAESQERELERLRLQLKTAEAKGASDLGTENAEIQAGARADEKVVEGGVQKGDVPSAAGSKVTADGPAKPGDLELAHPATSENPKATAFTSLPGSSEHPASSSSDTAAPRASANKGKRGTQPLNALIAFLDVRAETPSCKEEKAGLDLWRIVKVLLVLFVIIVVLGFIVFCEPV